MPRAKDTTRISRTHFEQVPVEIAKKAADGAVPKVKKGGTVRVDEAASGKK
jgi:hypothetical protein